MKGLSMSLRTKALLSIVFLLLVITGLLAVVTRQMFIAGAVRLENEDIYQAIDRMQAAVSAEETHLKTNVAIWAMRDAAYTFMQSGAVQALESDLLPQTLADMHIEFALYLDRQNTVVLSRVQDGQTAQVLPVPDGLEAAISAAARSAFYPQDDPQARTGTYVLLPQGVASVAFAPILPANRSGASAGTLAFGRFMDAAELQQIADGVHLPVGLTPLGDLTSLPDSMREALTQLSPQQPHTIQKDESGMAYGYALLNGADGQPVAVLDVRLSRNLFQQNSTAAWTLMLTFILGGMAGAVTLLLLLDASILRRVTRLTAGLRNRTAGQAPGIPSPDEIGQLTAAIQQALGAQDEQQGQQQSQIQQLEQRLNGLVEARAREGRFFKQAASEFRAPLTNLTTRLYLLSKSPDRLPEHMQVLNAMVAQTRALVDDVFDLARLDDGELSLEMTNVCLQDVLAELVSRRKASGMTILSLDQLPAETAFVRMDTTRFVQALDHLIQFAYEWSAPDHPIKLSMLARDASVLQVRLRLERLRKHNLNPVDVFRPFAYTTEKGATNTGLGMALALAIVRAHRGELRYEMRDSGGQFTLELARQATPDSRPLAAVKG
jgi:sensor domain CHASE-containing protein